MASTRDGTSLALFAASVLLCAAGVLAQPYPAKPVRMIVPFAAGGGTDIIARLIAQKVTDAWGQQMVVENRAGGGSVIGTEVVARSAADGYTLLLAAPPFATNAALLPRLPYDSLQDFAPVTLVATAPLIVVVHPSLPVRSIKELVAAARARPGQLSYGTSGNGGPQHLAGELLKSMADIDLLHIPYKGGAPAVVDLVGGQVQLGFASMLTALPFVKAGRLRAIAVTGARRSAILPNLPAVAEAGFPGYETTTWYGILARAGAPPAVIATLNADIARALNLPEVKDRLAGEGAEVVAGTPAAFASFIQTEIARVRKLSKSTVIKLD
jgi:tripartite-type tricarboxylate transporter receptor subunit TctC